MSISITVIDSAYVLQPSPLKCYQKICYPSCKWPWAVWNWNTKTCKFIYLRMLFPGLWSFECIRLLVQEINHFSKCIGSGLSSVCSRLLPPAEGGSTPIFWSKLRLDCIRQFRLAVVQSDRMWAARTRMILGHVIRGEHDWSCELLECSSEMITPSRVPSTCSIFSSLMTLRRTVFFRLIFLNDLVLDFRLCRCPRNLGTTIVRRRRKV